MKLVDVALWSKNEQIQNDKEIGTDLNETADIYEAALQGLEELQHVALVSDLPHCFYPILIWILLPLKMHPSLPPACQPRQGIFHYCMKIPWNSVDQCLSG